MMWAQEKDGEMGWCWIASNLLIISLNPRLNFKVNSFWNKLGKRSRYKWILRYDEVIDFLSARLLSMSQVESYVLVFFKFWRRSS